MSDAPTKPKDSYAGLDWIRVREEYETTDISVRELARRWGMRSENTLRRRLNAEHWVRDQNAITAGLVTAAVARSLAPLPEAPSAATPPTLSPAPSGSGVLMSYDAFATAAAPLASQSEKDRRAQEAAEAAHIDAHTPKRKKTAGQKAKDVLSPPKPPAPAHTTKPLRVAAEPHKPVAAPTVREAADAADLTTARSLASIHADAIAAQVRIADRMTEVGLKLLEVVDEAITGDDMDSVSQARSLLKISDKNDGLGSAVNAVAMLIEKAATMKRKALGMDLVAGRQSTPGGPLNGDAANARPDAAVRELLDALPIDALMAFRPTVVAVTKLRPSTMTIDAVIEGAPP